MCGRYTSTTSIDVLAETFAVDEIRTEPLPARYNVAPTQPILAVAARRSKDQEGKVVRALGTFKWGLVPSWAKDPSVGNKMINARAEGIGDKPAYRKALLKRRCLIPADAFYEWQPRPDVAGGKKRGKLPWAIRRRDRRPMAFAGLWELWRPPGADPDEAPLRTAVIVTTAANAALSSIHDRMPVVLGPDAWPTWLDPEVEDRATLEGLLVPAPDEWFEAFPVSTRVNKVDQDGPELLEPLPPQPDP
ncbi:SOS response-associated peptidase [Acidiferrimicrobium sp. IK]|uniref:SOS response-associated peptidase n=1 Tax=Acidiferrimicrobium sp. IK TaxID=2871700 RepID=UPI0021CB0C94|nr:SOS response-associated peptidase [Acidiferrimicrobium sp. IK]MCU4185333.1 SOS response-associated peptidase [Acidiferrimicrobium sp. IK]